VELDREKTPRRLHLRVVTFLRSRSRELHMSIIGRLASFAALIGGVMVFAAPPSEAAVIKSQVPCTTGGSFCVSFSGGGAIPTTIRDITFAAPSAGDAAVSFTGTMFCSAGGSSSLQRVVDFVTQIVPGAAVVPDITGSGALRQAMRLGAPGSDGFGLSTTVNLASTRVFHLNGAGNKKYYFNLATLRMDATMTCTIYDAAFTVVFAP
jgi:hypothetical protein